MSETVSLFIIFFIHTFMTREGDALIVCVCMGVVRVCICCVKLSALVCYHGDHGSSLHFTLFYYYYGAITVMTLVLQIFFFYCVLCIIMIIFYCQ